jgi:REP element-mobilizing transposase RayT
MPRKPRRDRDGDAHHVVLRGHSGSPIITSVDDALLLIASLADCFRRYAIAVWCWAVVTNHLHLLPVGPIAQISAALRDASSPYARFLNTRTGKRGSFFQDRFWSKPIGDDDYGRTGVVYVVRNSYTAGHVKSAEALETHPLCGYAPLLDDDAQLAMPTDVDGALRLFAPEPEAARRALRQQVGDSIGQWERDRGDRSLEAILSTVGGARGMPPEVLRSRSRHSWVTDARVEVVRLALVAGHSQTAIARALGVTRQAVARVVQKLAVEPVALGDGWRIRFAG